MRCVAQGQLQYFGGGVTLKATLSCRSLCIAGSPTGKPPAPQWTRGAVEPPAAPCGRALSRIVRIVPVPHARSTCIEDRRLVRHTPRVTALFLCP